MAVNNLGTFLNIKDSHLRVVSGNVYAQGINIGGITVDVAHGLQSITNRGNVTTNTLQFDNATTGFTTTANATIGRDLTVTGNATVSSNLTVTGNAVISDDLTVTENLLVSNNLTVTGNTFYTNPAAVLVDSNVVTEYTGPHDRPLRKYPEVAMTSAAATASGYKGYKVTASSIAGSIYSAWKAFNNRNDEPTGDYPWISQNNPDGYNSDNGLPLGANGDVFQGVDGAWLSVELPHNIKLSYMMLSNRNDSNNTIRSPKDIVVWGSLDGTTWTSLKTYTNTNDTQAGTYRVNINSTTVYKYFRLHFLTIHTGSDAVAIGEWELYGYEEGSGSLDTTLKSVYNVPATTGTQLEVYYDAKDLADGAVTAVTDLAGGDQNGTPGTGVTVADGAFVFDGTVNGNITGDSNSLAGNWIHTMSTWIYFNSLVNGAVLGVRPSTFNFSGNNEVSMLYARPTGFIWDFGNQNNNTTTLIPLTNKWYHIALVADGTGIKKMYIDNQLQTSFSFSNTTNIVMQTNSPLDIGRGNLDGKISNFRLFNKALNADQVKELYDYQKDYFLGSKSQVTLYKGHLGVGVTEPSGQLELAGDERLQEYPPRGLVGDPLVFDPAGNAYDYNVEGHGVFKLLSSYRYHASTSDDRRIYEFFDKDVTVTQTHWASFNSSAPYDAAGGSGAWITTLDGGSTITAHIAEIQMPYKITLKRYTLTSGSQVPRALKTAMIVGSNDGNVYHVLHNVSDFGFTATSQTKEYTVDNATTPYRIFRLLLMNTNGHTACNMRQWRLFGTPGPTTLDKGSLSLARSLDVPRISRYDVDTETPRPEKLLVDFDTTVNSSPTDISGQGNHGTFYNGASYSAADKAFNFDGTDDYIEAVTNLGSGNRTLCFSMWIKPETDNRWFIDLGKNTATGGSFFAIRYDTYYQFNVKNGNHIHISAGPLNTWEHLVIIYHGTGSTKTAGTIEGYVNGVLANLIASDFADDQLNLSANPPIEIGARTSASNTYFDGQISNFKLYDVALEPSEVKKLYNLGRTGRSMVISDTAVGIGKVPEAQLDVRGILNVDGDIFLNGFKIFQPITPIARDGLAVLLDASDPNSYPASGNYFYDTSGNGRHGTAQGSVGWTSSGQQSYFNFPGADADKLNQTSGSSLLYRDICVVFKVDVTSGFEYIISNGGDNSLRVVNAIIPSTGNVGDWSSGGTTYYVNGVATTSNVPITAGQWYILGGENKSYSSPLNYTLGYGYPGRALDGKIAFVALYNRVLSAEEQLQNYTALKRRFGV